MTSVAILSFLGVLQATFSGIAWSMLMKVGDSSRKLEGTSISGHICTIGLLVTASVTVNNSDLKTIAWGLLAA